jgi:hypothetical protein
MTTDHGLVSALISLLPFMAMHFKNAFSKHHETPQHLNKWKGEGKIEIK